MTGKIILLTDIYEMRKRKEEELAYYNEQLEKLKQKMFFIQKDIEITNLCIEIIEKETVLDIKELVENKKTIDIQPK
jgi:hypothetical protein